MASSWRYNPEFMLNVLVVARFRGRQRDFERSVLPPEPACNLYIVSQAPRISAAPDSVRFTDAGELFVTLRQQVKGEFREYPVYIQYFKEDTSGLYWQSDWPYEDFRIYDANGDFTGGPVSTWFRTVGQLPDALAGEEVLYVGQAFGKSGERTAYDRLASHSTLQRIYSEVDPDKEIWLTLCSIDDVMLHTVIPPSRQMEKSDEDNNAHMDQIYARFNSPDFWEREVVTGAEAGLINYFKPRYNLIFKHNYPDPDHVHISLLYELEIHTLVIELQSHELHLLKFGSPLVEPKSVHFAYFQLGELTSIFDW
jgi:hypothetical protein